MVNETLPKQETNVEKISTIFEKLKLNNDQSDSNPAKRPARHQPENTIEPSYIQEFREISSQYLIENKEDSEEISSDEEFRNADKMMVYNEDDTELHKIDAAKKWRKETNMLYMTAP